MPNHDTEASSAGPSSAGQSSAGPRNPEPFDFEGDCVGCGQRSAHLNRDTLCRRCVSEPDTQTRPALV